MSRTQAGVDALSLEDTYSEKLVSMVREIKQEAQGRTCGECVHYRPAGWCSEIETARGDALTVFYPTAVACGSYEAR